MGTATEKSGVLGMIFAYVGRGQKKRGGFPSPWSLPEAATAQAPGADFALNEKSASASPFGGTVTFISLVPNTSCQAPTV